MRQIALALQGYHDKYGTFPPAYIADPTGKPIHSWRVLILPFLECGPLYKQYDFNEPWDGPHNRVLAQYSIEAYRCPSDKNLPPGITSYVAIEGPETAWGKTLNDITDGTDQTVMVIDCDNLGINWMEPRDLPASVVRNHIDSPPTGMSGPHPAVILAAFADAHVGPIQKGLDRETWSALITCAGGETFDREGKMHSK